ncbi:potassium channel family protein [Mesobacillus harenae]|uniref:potassium channel family protein n=1 Tax=Mesobacillus harenae TaxID=2213203 RepID=UPI001580F2D9|nr:TrkA family potassium uptake protein [Mesobacillus harenae]
MKKQFAVIGLGRFGGSLVEEFHELGAEVLAIDKSQDKVDKFGAIATHAVQANAINENVLKQLGIRNIDHAIVSFGEDVEASVLTTLLLKELGIKQVWVKASNEYHHRVLEKIGADRVIHPERDMAKRIAHHVISEKLIDYIELCGNHSIVEVAVSPKIRNKTLLDLNVWEKYGCNIIGIQRGEDIILSPQANQQVNEQDILILIGHNKDLQRFEDYGV